MNHQITAVELFAVTTTHGIAGEGIGHIRIGDIQKAGVGAAGNLREAVFKHLILAGNVQRQLEVVQHCIVLTGQANAINVQRAFIRPAQAVHLNLGFHLDGDACLASDVAQGTVVQWTEVGHHRQRQTGGQAQGKEPAQGRFEWFQALAGVSTCHGGPGSLLLCRLQTGLSRCVAAGDNLTSAADL